MSILKGVLLEELNRNLKNQKLYKGLLENLPKGSIFISDRNGKKYVYRKYRLGSKVINKYICSYSDSDRVKEASEKYEEYVRVSRNLKMLGKEEIKLRKALKAYEI